MQPPSKDQPVDAAMDAACRQLEVVPSAVNAHVLEHGEPSVSFEPGGWRAYVSQQDGLPSLKVRDPSTDGRDSCKAAAAAGSPSMPNYTITGRTARAQVPIFLRARDRFLFAPSNRAPFTTPPVLNFQTLGDDARRGARPGDGLHGRIDTRTIGQAGT
jgi:hypothetical protein